MGCLKLHIIEEKYGSDIAPYKLLNPNKGVGSYRFSFNGMERDDEMKGSGNSYDFGARIYDARVGRWLAKDPFSLKYPDYSTYHFAYCNPNIVIDPNGKENVIIIGGTSYSPIPKSLFKAAIYEAKRIRDNFTENNEKTTILVYSADYTKTELKVLKANLLKNGFEESDIHFVTTKEEIVQYVNEKKVDDKEVGSGRSEDLITDFSYVGHAWSGGLDFSESVGVSLVGEDFKKSAFNQEFSKAHLIGCNTACEDYYAPEYGDIAKNVTEYFANYLVSGYAIGAQDLVWMGTREGKKSGKPGYTFQSRGSKTYVSPMKKVEIKPIEVQEAVIELPKPKMIN